MGRSAEGIPAQRVGYPEREKIGSTDSNGDDRRRAVATRRVATERFPSGRRRSALPEKSGTAACTERRDRSGRVSGKSEPAAREMQRSDAPSEQSLFGGYHLFFGHRSDIACLPSRHKAGRPLFLSLQRIIPGSPRTRGAERRSPIRNGNPPFSVRCEVTDGAGGEERERGSVKRSPLSCSCGRGCVTR